MCTGLAVYVSRVLQFPLEVSFANTYEVESFIDQAQEVFISCIESEDCDPLVKYLYSKTKSAKKLGVKNKLCYEDGEEKFMTIGDLLCALAEIGDCKNKKELGKLFCNHISKNESENCFVICDIIKSQLKEYIVDHDLTEIDLDSFVIRIASY